MYPNPVASVCLSWRDSVCCTDADDGHNYIWPDPTDFFFKEHLPYNINYFMAINETHFSELGGDQHLC
jgi:hypothetical protein